MTISITHKELFEKALQMYTGGSSIEAIALFLKEEKTAPEIIDQLVKELHHKKQVKKGILWIGVGSALLIISFLLTVFFFHSGIAIDFVMYGLTTLGIIIAVIGLKFLLD
jgi:pheromone shutdown protein TraB